jgi:hypothetical protein
MPGIAGMSFTARVAESARIVESRPVRWAATTCVGSAAMMSHTAMKTAERHAARGIIEDIEYPKKKGRNIGRESAECRTAASPLARSADAHGRLTKAEL